MYERTSNSGHPVVWNPDDEDTAVEAMEAVDAIPDHVSLPDDANVPVDKETADKIRQKYRELRDVKEE